MSQKFPEYEPFFHKGLRIEIGIPQPSGDVFRDWAVVREFFEDTILVQLSRDYLPSNVRVNISSILDASVWIDQQIYTCTCIVTERDGARNLRLRLFGLLTLKERRQFFRLECTFNFRFTDPDRRIREEVEHEWQKRHELEMMRSGGYDDIVIMARRSELQDAAQEHVWFESSSKPAVLSGGGIGFKLDRKLKPETLLHMELTLPLGPPRIVHAVAEVVHVQEPPTESDTPTYRTGFQFVYMAERDRDEIFRYISQLQLLRLREMSDNRPFLAPSERMDTKPGLDLERVLMRTLCVLVLIAVSLWIWKQLVEYRQRGNTNEIKMIYENSIKKYRKEY